MSMAPRLPEPLTPESLQGLMRERPYWDTNHPRFPDYQRIVKRGFEILYPGNVRYDVTGRMVDVPPLPPERIKHLVAQTNREMDSADGGYGGQPDGAVHVQAHSRDGGKTEVSDYWRAPPGQGSHGDGGNHDNSGEDGSTHAGTDGGRPMSQSPAPNPEIRNDGAGGGHFGANREGGREHQGIDILANPGEEIVSPVDGVVTGIRGAYKDNEKKFDGEFLAVEIKGKDGNTHILRYVAPTDAEGNPLIKEGDAVKVGDPIGTAQDRAARDESGKMKNHIHLEMKDKDNRLIDPTPHFNRWRKAGKR